jgi:hypothetical protein
MRFVVAEYPKAGGTWVVGLIGDAVGLRARHAQLTAAVEANNVANLSYTDGR